MTNDEAMERLRACLARMRERAAKQRAPVPVPPPDAPTPPSPHQERQ